MVRKEWTASQHVGSALDCSLLAFVDDATTAATAFETACIVLFPHSICSSILQRQLQPTNVCTQVRMPYLRTSSLSPRIDLSISPPPPQTFSGNHTNSEFTSLHRIYNGRVQSGLKFLHIHNQSDMENTLPTAELVITYSITIFDIDVSMEWKFLQIIILPIPQLGSRSGCSGRSQVKVCCITADIFLLMQKEGCMHVLITRVEFSSHFAFENCFVGEGGEGEGVGWEGFSSSHPTLLFFLFFSFLFFPSFARYTILSWDQWFTS